MRNKLIKLLDECIEPEFPWDTNDDLAEHLLSNGVIVPPCKVGETVWFVSRGKTKETSVEKIVLMDGELYLKLSCHSFCETSCRSIGKTVFFSKKEAEQALKRGEE